MYTKRFILNGFKNVKKRIQTLNDSQQDDHDKEEEGDVKENSVIF